MSLELVESFLSVQGEGKYQGKLSIFLRFFGCNLNCKGFNVQLQSPKTGETLIGCDTIRAVHGSHFRASTSKISNHTEIMKVINTFCIGLKQKPMIVITGGEPLINHKNEIFTSLLNQLINENFTISFETNSTINVDFEKFPIYKKCIFAMGIKLSNSGVEKEKRINKEAIQNIVKNSQDSFYKFVLNGEDNELQQINEILEIYDNEVWCMPLGAQKEELEENALDVMNFCIKNGFNYSDRIHIRIWDKKEGV